MTTGAVYKMATHYPPPPWAWRSHNSSNQVKRKDHADVGTTSRFHCSAWRIVAGAATALSGVLLATPLPPRTPATTRPMCNLKIDLCFPCLYLRAHFPQHGPSSHSLELFRRGVQAHNMFQTCSFTSLPSLNAIELPGSDLCPGSK